VLLGAGGDGGYKNMTGRDATRSFQTGGCAPIKQPKRSSSKPVSQADMTIAGGAPQQQQQQPH
jgi:hypothetical protein